MGEHFCVMLILFSGRVFEGMEVRPFACWDCVFECRWWHDLSLPFSLSLSLSLSLL
jgi:hypothetical protein